VKTIFNVFANIMKSILQRVWRLNSTSLHCDGGLPGRRKKSSKPARVEDAPEVPVDPQPASGRKLSICHSLVIKKQKSACICVQYSQDK
jgi:hypothetical protein